MKTLTIEMPDPSADVWRQLSPPIQQLITSRALSAILNGNLYPTGSDQLDLAIELAEAGISPDVISKISGLTEDMFKAFLRQP